jgi:hypothetical protein
MIAELIGTEGVLSEDLLSKLKGFKETRIYLEK